LPNHRELRLTTGLLKGKIARTPKLAKMAFIGQEIVRKQHTDITS